MCSRSAEAEVRGWALAHAHSVANDEGNKNMEGYARWCWQCTHGYIGISSYRVAAAPERILKHCNRRHRVIFGLIPVGLIFYFPPVDFNSASGSERTHGAAVVWCLVTALHHFLREFVQMWCLIPEELSSKCHAFCLFCLKLKNLFPLLFCCGTNWPWVCYWAQCVSSSWSGFEISL